MLTETQFDDWLHGHGIGKRAEEVIRRIRTSPPSRHVQGGKSNVSGRYPSCKMGVTIQSESHKDELPFIREYEYDDDILEYYDQPGPIRIEYQLKSGRKICVLTTPDFFVIRRDGTAGWDECKPETVLESIYKKSNRFVKDDGGLWKSPPAEKYAEAYGLFFRVRSSSEINWIWQRNIEYLSDYLQDQKRQLDQDKVVFAAALVSCKQGILLSELLSDSGRFTTDDVLYMLARNHLYVDLHAHPLPEHDRVPVFTSALHDRVGMTAKNYLGSQQPLFITLEVGSRFTWDGTPLEIVNVGNESIWFTNDHGKVNELSIGELECLVKTGKVRGINKSGSSDDEIYAKLKENGPGDFASANAKSAAISIYLEGCGTGVMTRSERRWLRRYRDAELQYNCGFLGLFDNTKNKGNKNSKLPKETIDLMDACIEEHYLTYNQSTIISAFGVFCNMCDELGIIPTSLKTFSKRINNVDVEERTRKRKGPRSAYQVGTFYWELPFTTPKHGDRPFEIAHLDHTELDLHLVDSKRFKSLGRPWLTLLVDAFSRRILAFFISFEPPSYRACMMVLRECVSRFGRLPQNIVVDRGAEFGSIYFETLLARYNVIKKERPGAEPRFGSVLERLFGTTNTLFVNNMQGNTQIMKNVRQVTKSVNPENRAIWTLPHLTDAIKRFLYEKYDNREHPALFESPRDAFESGIIQHGSRPTRLIPYDNAFIMSTFPSTSKGTAKAVPSRGIKINYVYYWHEALHTVSGTQIPVRYDPYDVSTAYAYVGKTWVTCRSQYYAQFRGLSEYELKAITAEIAQSQRISNQMVGIKAQHVAAFIADLRGTEKTLRIMKKAAELKTDNPEPVETSSMGLQAQDRVSATEIYGTL